MNVAKRLVDFSILFVIAISFLLQAGIVLASSPFTSEFNGYAKECLEKSNGVGLAIGVIDHENVFSQTYGYRSIEQGKKLSPDPDTLFAIGSLTKSFTSTALGLLVDRGLVQFDDPVRKYLRDFRLPDNGLAERVTVADLLSHRVGLPSNDNLWYSTSFDRQTLYQKLQFLDINPKTIGKFQYSNLMYMVAGLLTEKVLNASPNSSHLKWEEFVQTDLLTKLGMNHTHVFFSDIESIENKAYPFSFDEQSKNIIRIPFKNDNVVAPAGSIFSTVNDMLKWLKLQINRGKLNGSSFISDTTFNSLMKGRGSIETQPRLSALVKSLFGSDSITYALGWYIVESGPRQLVFHLGGVDGYLSFIVYSPSEKIGVVALTNSTQFSPNFLAIDLLNRMRGHKTKLAIEKVLSRSKANTVSSEEQTKFKIGSNISEVRPWLGRFLHGAYGDISVVEKSDAKLIWTYQSKQYEMLPMGEKGRFKLRTKSPMLGASVIEFMHEGGIYLLKWYPSETEYPIVFKKSEHLR